MRDGAQNLHKANATVGERPVFVTDGPWRKRAVAMATAAGGALLLVWLLGVFAGALGLGHLGPLPLWGVGRTTSSAPEKSPASHPHPLPSLPAVGGLPVAGPGSRVGPGPGAAAPSAGATRPPAQANADPAGGESRGASKTRPPGSGTRSTPQMPEAVPSPAATTGAAAAGGGKPPAAAGAGGGSSTGPAPARPEATPSGRPIPDGPTVTPSESGRTVESMPGR
jgi:hypothetical protein